MIKEAIKFLSYAIFPKRCPLCGEVIALGDEKCEECINQKRIFGEICTDCGFSKEDCTCTNKTQKPQFKQIVSPYYFEDNIVKAIHRFKLYGYTELAQSMGDEITKVVIQRYKDIRFDYVTYVPMTKRKLRKRGYNQSKLLAEEVSKIMGVPLVDALIKTVETQSQRGSTAKERRLNLYGAFDICDDVELDNKTILLIDDVKTTGSTLNECAVMLKASGSTVYCATLAVAKNNKLK